MDPFTDDAAYELVVRGELDERYGSLFEGMQMTRRGGTTILLGTVRDGAELYGHIERIEELGLVLVSMRQVSEPPTDLESDESVIAKQPTSVVRTRGDLEDRS